MTKKYLVLVCSVLILVQNAQSAKLENKQLSRHKRTILSTISNWWYGEPTTLAPVEDLPFRDEVNYVNYPYYNPTGVGSYPIQYIPQPPPPHEDDLGRLARELGIRHIRNLPKIEEVMGLLGTNTKDETIQAIREFAATPGGVDMIESFLAPESEEVKDEYQPLNSVKQEVVVAPPSNSPVPVQNIIPNETVEKLPEQLRTGVHQPKALALPQTQTEEQKLGQISDRFSIDMELAQKVPHETPGFFSRLGYYANFLNPFSLSQPADVPLPTEKIPVVTVRPVIYRYPEGYDPHTKTFTNNKNRIELLEEEHKKLSGVEQANPVSHVPSSHVQPSQVPSPNVQPHQTPSGPFVRFPQEIQPLIRTPQHPQFTHNAIINAPIPAYIYQSSLGNPYFVDQHRLAGVPYGFPAQGHQTPVQNLPLTINLGSEDYTPGQVQKLKDQGQSQGQFVSVPLPPVVNSAVSNFNQDDGSFNIDVRFGQPIHVIDHEASASEVQETVVKKTEDNKSDDSVTTTTTTTTEVPETLKALPVQTTESSEKTVTTTTTTTTEKPVMDEVKEEGKIVTVLPDKDFFENFDAPKEIGEKVIESVTNLTAESLSEPEKNVNEEKKE